MGDEVECILGSGDPWWIGDISWAGVILAITVNAGIENNKTEHSNEESIRMCWWRQSTIICSSVLLVGKRESEENGYQQSLRSARQGQIASYERAADTRSDEQGSVGRFRTPEKVSVCTLMPKTPFPLDAGV